MKFSDKMGNPQYYPKLGKTLIMKKWENYVCKINFDY